MRSGRALVFPVYKGTYERRVDVTGVNSFRDVAIATGKDFGRVVELIDSRRDLDRQRVAFYGDSRGTFFGVILTALEPRLQASVLLGGGLPPVVLPPELDLLNFAPRVHMPTLMVSGRGDFLQPVESAQVPLFRLLGVPAEHKRHALFEGGHFPNQLHDVMREILDWFDRYLGTVTPDSVRSPLRF
jgi:pimeloyl-ACP methyl ester carboxylesterase